MNSAIVPTKVLSDPTELERILQSGLHAQVGNQATHGDANGYSFDVEPIAFSGESFPVTSDTLL